MNVGGNSAMIRQTDIFGLSSIRLYLPPSPNAEPLAQDPQFGEQTANKRSRGL